AMLNGFFAVVDEVLRRYGGTIDKHIGDAVMAVFGAPVAHTDDPERALRAARDIHAAVASLSPPLKVHIGVASGRVVASSTGSAEHTEYTVTGDSVNLAARLTDLASPDETLASASVQRALGGRFKGADLGARMIAGLPEPVTVYRLEDIAEERIEQKPFVGRRRELQLCEAAISRCLARGTGETFIFRGEAGIGKSRLLEEFERLAAKQGFDTHTGLVLDFGTAKGQDAVGALVRSLLAIAANSGKETRREAAERVLADGLLATDRRVFLHDLLDLEPPEALRDLYDGMNNTARVQGRQATVAELAEALSRHRPIVVKIEDLHWADANVLEHIAHLARTTAKCRMLLLLTTRLAGDQLTEAWRRSIPDAEVETLDLGPMALSEAEDLAHTIDDLSGDLIRDIIARAGGNPLFLEQLLRNADQIGASELPGSVQGIVQARLDALPQRDRGALQAASILGQRFSLSALGHVMDDSGYSPDGLLDQALIRAAGEDFHFAHALIGDGVHASLLKPRRKELHGRAATYYRDRDGVLLAEHLEHAEDESAGEAYLNAAKQQADGFRYDPALRLVERALKLDGEAATRFELRRLEGELLKDLGQMAASVSAFEQALELAESDEQFCRASLGLAAGLHIENQHDRAMACLDGCLEMAERNAFHDLLADLHHLRGNLYLPLKRIDKMRQEHEKSLNYAQLIASPYAEARALGGLGDVGYGDGRMKTGKHYFSRCVEIAERHGLARISALYKPMQAFCELFLLELERAEETGLSAVSNAARTGDAYAEMIAHNCLSEVYFLRHDFEAMRFHGERSLEIVHRIGAKRFEFNGMLTRARYQHYHDDDQAAALETYRDTYRISMATKPGFTGAWVTGRLAMAADSPEERDWALREGERLLEDGAHAHNHFYFRVDAMEVCLREKDSGGVLKHAAGFERFVGDEPTAWSDFFICRGRALTAFGQGGRDLEAIAELKSLKSIAANKGLKWALPEIDAALAECGNQA
ncbi:MAG: adenylate/guanylate cyclase domain-containing protein, partial [Alphaproteobacteria bacterium]